MDRSLKSMNNLSLCAIVLAGIALLAGGANCQDYYVDAELGSNFNSGGASDPWQTVNFALTGPHAPLPWNSIIHLYMTNYVSYCINSGEAFPLVLYNNISIIGDKRPDGTGDTLTVDALGSGMNIIEYTGTMSFKGCVVRGYSADGGLTLHTPLLFKNGNIAVSMEPQAKTHAPEIYWCTIQNVQSQAIRVVGSANSIVAPYIHDNTIEECGWDAGGIVLEMDGCQPWARIENNSITKNQSTPGHGIRLYGTTSTPGMIVVSDNTINFYSSDKYHAYNGIYFDNFTGRVDCLDNTINYDGNGIYFLSSNPWHPASRVEGNICKIYDNYYDDKAGIFVEWTNDVTLKGNTCSGSWRGDGICGWYSKQVVSIDNLCENNRRHGIYLNNCDGGSVAEGNSVLGNGYENGNPNGQAGILLRDSDGATVRDNLVSGNGGRGISLKEGSGNCDVIGNDCSDNFYKGIGVTESTDCLVAGNRMKDNAGGGLLIESKSATVACNLVDGFNGAYSGIVDGVCDGSVYCSNIVINNTSHGFELTETSSSNPPLIFHNTAANNGGNGLWTSLNSLTSPYVANNIFFYNNNGGNDIAGLAFGQYYNNDIGKGGSSGNGNIDDDPLFIGGGDYGLQPGSPCIDAGLNYCVEWGTDFAGVPRVLDGDWSGAATTDMGAHEFGEVGLALSGTFQPGTILTLDITGPASAAGGDFDVYAAAGSESDPLGPQPGLYHLFYGTFLLDVSKLYLGGPVLSGELDGNGSATVDLTLPASVPVGYHVAMQTAVTETDTQGNPIAGQLTAAETFVIQP